MEAESRRRNQRFLVLPLLCFLGLGSYFCYDSAGALQTEIKRDMRVSTASFMSLYSWYSWPNTVLCFFGGFLIDRVWGIRLGAIIFSTFLLVGQVVFALGGLVNTFWVMDLGRFIFGLGGESLCVAQNAYAVSWFKGKELNTVFGLQLSMARVGSTAAFNAMQPVYNWVSGYYSGYICLGIALMLAASTTLFSLICSLITGFLDKRAERNMQKNSAETGETVRFRDALHMPISFWLISIICVLYYVAIFPFVSLDAPYLMKKFGMPSTVANSAVSVVYLVSAFASPLLGFAVDKTGRNVFWVACATVVTIGCHGLLTFSFVSPWISTITMGFGYSLMASALWPMVALVVPEHQLGTAYGLMQSIQNTGLAVVTLLAGFLVDNYGYFVLQIFFLSCVCMAVMCIVILWLIDSASGGSLNLSVEQRTQLEQQLEIAETLEREKLLASGTMAEVTPHDLLQPQSEFYLRNRYLCKLGVGLLSNNAGLCGLYHRIGLK